MLLCTDKSSKEIGWELGFEEPSQFNRFFKKQTGLPPQEFRDKFSSYVFKLFNTPSLPSSPIFPRIYYRCVRNWFEFPHQ
ncbi:helix-turn-helix domain-containing protein [Pleomorphovibrio marinus]|uniref:helix-turn-helix domain-containing protein n=1 Tax=Pleomorphovibrio marinus TaxID=2164132 RepID=UPI002937351C|nr:helix-turn-helix domain-containing protein [Pleomorphovibrio marinus]